MKGFEYVPYPQREAFSSWETHGKLKWLTFKLLCILGKESYYKVEHTTLSL